MLAGGVSAVEDERWDEVADGLSSCAAATYPGGAVSMFEVSRVAMLACNQGGGCQGGIVDSDIVLASSGQVWVVYGVQEEEDTVFDSRIGQN